MYFAPPFGVGHQNIQKNKQETTTNMSYQRTPAFVPRRQQNWSRNQNTVAFVSSVKLGPVAHTVIVALMITVLGLIYLTQATRATSYDYTSQQLDSQIANLNNQESDLKVENARLTALETVKNSTVAAAMTKPASTQYANQ
jgi:cell division protein FtsL